MTTLISISPPTSIPISPGLEEIMPKSIEAPTAIKNRPRRSPLKGSMSPSSSWRYSLFANTTPARNVPRAGLKPTFDMRRAMPITSSSAAAVKSSLNFVPATARNKGLTRKSPPMMIAVITDKTTRAWPQPLCYWH